MSEVIEKVYGRIYKGLPADMGKEKKAMFAFELLKEDRKDELNILESNIRCLNARVDKLENRIGIEIKT